MIRDDVTFLRMVLAFDVDFADRLRGHRTSSPSLCGPLYRRKCLNVLVHLVLETNAP